MSERAWAAIADEGGLTWAWGNELYERIRWHDLAALDVETNDQGPWAEDVHYVFTALDGRSIEVPGLLVDDALLTHMQALPGFDNEALIAAMACADNAVFPLWRRVAPDTATSGSAS